MPTAVVLVNGLPGAGKTSLARELSAHTGWPCLSKDDVKEALADLAPAVPSGRLGAVAMDTVWALAAAVPDVAPGVVVVESWWFRPRDLEFARTGLSSTGASRSAEVWCDVDPALARQRYAARQRSALHDDAARLARDYDHWAAHAEPLGLGPVVRVDTGHAVDLAGLHTALRPFLDG